MVYSPKVIGMMSCSFLLFLGLSITGSAIGEMKVVPPAGPTDRQGGQAGHKGELDKLKASHLIAGQVLRVEGDDYYVRQKNGKEVRLHTDPTTEKIGRNIQQGDRIEADVDNMNNVLVIRPMN